MLLTGVIRQVRLGPEVSLSYRDREEMTHESSSV